MTRADTATEALTAEQRNGLAAPGTGDDLEAAPPLGSRQGQSPVNSCQVVTDGPPKKGGEVAE